MEEKTVRIRQMEALEVMYDYLGRLVPAVEAVIVELRETKQTDTEDFLKTVINGINWSIEVLNRTKDLINEEEVIEKDNINYHVNNLGVAIREQDDLKIAESLEKGILPFLKTISSRVGVITNRAV